MTHTTPIIDRDKEREETARGDFRGPTKERVEKAVGDFVVGGDERTTRIYHFTDTPLSRLYKRLAAADKSENERKQLTAEHVALLKYRHHWYHAGLEANCGSVDPNRIFAADPSNFSGMAKSEAQVTHRQMVRKAVKIIGHQASILLDNFVCYEWDRGIASGLSPYRFRAAVRSAAAQLAEHWGTA
jgi:hypothetical protein